MITKSVSAEPDSGVSSLSADVTVSDASIPQSLTPHADKRGIGPTRPFVTEASAARRSVCHHARVHRRGGRNWRVAALASVAVLLASVAALAPATAVADPPILSVQVGSAPVGRAMPPG